MIGSDKNNKGDQKYRYLVEISGMNKRLLLGWGWSWIC